MREITSHNVDPRHPEGLRLFAADEPGAGGAHHVYRAYREEQPGGAQTCLIQVDFQNGPIQENGVNGVTHEALLAIVIDRLQSFQAGPFAGRENALALTHLQEAQHWLHHRTRARIARGVEGTSQK